MSRPTEAAWASPEKAGRKVRTAMGEERHDLAIAIIDAFRLAIARAEAGRQAQGDRRELDASLAERRRGVDRALRAGPLVGRDRIKAALVEADRLAEEEVGRPIDARAYRAPVAPGVPDDIRGPSFRRALVTALWCSGLQVKNTILAYLAIEQGIEEPAPSEAAFNTRARAWGAAVDDITVGDRQGEARWGLLRHPPPGIR